MHISAKVDYAVRALVALAAAEGGPTSADALAAGQGIPPKFLETILTDLRRGGLVVSQRGSEGGYRLARPAGDISVADVMRTLDGPLAAVHGMRPEAATYPAPAEHVQEVWVAVRASLRSVLEHVSLDDLVKGRLPRTVKKLTGDPEAWKPH